MERAINKYTNSFPNFRLVYSSPDKHLADLPAYLIEGQYQNPEFGEQKIIEMGIIKDNKNYFIQYFANASQYTPPFFKT